LPLASLDWTQIIIACIGASVAIANGLGILLVLTHLRTPSGKHVGALVEDVQHTALANHYRIRALSSELAVTEPREAVEESERAEESYRDLHYGKRENDE
jgi:hypothetical protein